MQLTPKTRMNPRTLISLAVLFCFGPLAALAADKPVILSPVLNGASFEGHIPPPSGPMPLGTGLAGGSIFVLFGTDLGPAELVLGSVPYPDQLPAGTGGTRVTFRSLENNQIYTAPLIHSLRTQVSGIVPSSLPPGLADLTVSHNGNESEPTKVLIVEFSPALFAVSQLGRGPAVVQNYETPVVQPLNTLTHPAAPGQYLILWGTGLGAIEGPDSVAPAPGNLRDDVSVYIGNVEIPAEYAGRSPEFPGVDQVNVRIPDDGSIELGCYQDIGIKIGNFGFGAQTSVSISDTPGECDHPWGLSADKLADLDAGGDVTFLNAALSPEFSVVKAARLDAYGVSQNRPRLLISGAFSTWPPMYGSCLPATVFQAPPPPDPPGPLRLPAGHRGLDIGDTVGFAGPGARAFSLPKSAFDPAAFGPVTDLGEDALVGGDWTLSAAGGADLGAFSSKFSIAPFPELLLPATVQLGSEIDVTWDGSAYQDDARIVISLRPNPEELPQSGLKSLRCVVDAAHGSVEVTAQQLAWLEAEPGSPLLWTISIEGAPQAIEAEGLDYGSLTALVSMEVEATAEE